MTKAAKQRLLASRFFHEVAEIVKAWDYYLHIGNREAADEMMHKWQIAKLALEHITGNLYGFSRNGETYSIVNERDYSDRLIVEKSVHNDHDKIICRKCGKPVDPEWHDHADEPLDDGHDDY